MVKDQNGDPILCPICFSKLDGFDGHGGLECPRCGKYRITGSLWGMLVNDDSWLGGKNSRERKNLSAWLRETSPAGMLDSNFLKPEEHDLLGDMYRSTPEPSFFEKVDKLLLSLRRKTGFIGERIDWFDHPLYYEAVSWSLNDTELANLFDYMENVGMIEGGIRWLAVLTEPNLFSGNPVKIAPNGWERLQELDHVNAESDQGFIACKFDDDILAFAQSNIASAIEKAGYKPLLIIDKEHTEKIDDQIFAEIKRSRFVVADFTGQKQNVYYEAGYARGLGIPVIWTCAKDEIDDLHFDIRQYNCLDWEPNKLDEFRKRLRYRIEAILGRGPNPPSDEEKPLKPPA